MAVASQLGADAHAPWFKERAASWRTVSTGMRCSLFVLGAVAAGLTAAIFALLHIPANLLVAGLVLIGLAEWLAVTRRLFDAGVEEALELGGLLMIAFWIAQSSGHMSAALSALLIAVVLAAAGARFLNALFTTLAVLVLSFAIDSTFAAPTASLFCFAAAAMALICGRAPLRRPSQEQTLNFLMVAMPLAGYAWGWSAALRSTATVHWLPVCMLLAYGAGAIWVGIRRRRHWPIVAFLACLLCLAYELRNVTGLPLEVRLVVWGSAALALAAVLDRYLRTPRQGITSIKLAADEESMGLLQSLGAASLTPHAAHAADPQFRGGGGAGGGGGGASGNY